LAIGPLFLFSPTLSEGVNRVPYIGNTHQPGAIRASGYLESPFHRRARQWRLSHGPVTDEGKQRSSLNAVKHGLTASNPILPGDNLQTYNELVQGFASELNPVGAVESGLVRTIANIQHQLDRAAPLMEALDASQAQGEGGDQDAAIPDRAALEKQQKTYTNMAMLISRLRKVQETTMKQLQELQAARKAQQQEDIEEAIAYAKYHEMLSEPFNPADHGFVFTREQIEKAMARQKLRDEINVPKSSQFRLDVYQRASDWPPHPARSANKNWLK
jgi:hypothetical protein